MPANRFIERLLMPSSLRRADVILCVSEATKADVVTHFPGVAEKTIVIHEAATPMAAPPLDRAGNYFLFVGTLEPRKNLGRVIEAFARAKEKGLGDCKLVIVGAEGWGDRIDAVVSAAGLGNDVELPGHVDDVELHQKLAGAIALLLPSLHEGFGLPALEAMQYGTPVIGANVSSIPEIVGDGGILVDPLSKTSISEALIILATDAERRQVLADNARRQAAKFSWEQAADETLAAFSALIANASQRTDGK